MAYERSTNLDGTVSSHCPDCNRTVSTQASETDLDIAEEHHICDEFIARLILERLRIVGWPIN